MGIITVHCVSCGAVFRDDYAKLEAWDYHCEKCRVGMTPHRMSKYTDEGNEEEEES